MQETWVRSLGWEDSPGGGHGNPLQYSCLENPHGQSSLEGYSPRGHKELDTTEQLSTAQIKKKAAIWSNKWMNLEDNMLSEITTEKQIAYDLAYM